MALRIKILPEQLTNKIAAGEVVERPASVVKELVENAIDSGARDIIIEIESGGKRLLRVTDDGCGMSREDALLALERHATSKIATDSDLFGLTTLGFRGEALPSIASVSRFTLATREEGRLEGTEIYAEGGKIREVKACGMAVGTVVTVRNLFFNVPARLKFMKSIETEAGHVGDLLTKLALSRPDLRFTYINEGKTVFRVAPADLAGRVAALLGKHISSSLHMVESCAGGVRVEGLVASPECSRSSTASMYTYINGRYIRDKVVQHAILQAYRNSLERGRFPVVMLSIAIPPDEVDVNVHPTKHEVRFREQGRVHDAIMGAVESVLRASPWIKQPQPAPPSTRPVQPDPAPARIGEVRESLAVYQAALPASIQVAPVFLPRQEKETSAGYAAPSSPTTAAGFFSSLTVIGQFNSAYIICQGGTDLIMIDQHAAHERVAFERLKLQFQAGAVESQGLLFPQTMEFSHGEAATLREHAANLATMGLELENFGGSTWILKSIPRFLPQDRSERFVRDTVEDLSSLGKSRHFSDLRDDILARIACHSVVRGMHPLTVREIQALFAQMDATDFSASCPHGRPVFRTLSFHDIERMFKR